MESFTFSHREQISLADQQKALSSLEEGKIVFLPHYHFPIETKEEIFFSPDILKKGSKNISYNAATGALGGVHEKHARNSFLYNLLKRYAEASKNLLSALFPSYTSHLKQGRTSFRPAETKGRALSKRKDDTLLHVDSFPSNPVGGKRILRVFTNVNPFKQARVWQTGESFEQVVAKIAPRLTPPLPLSSLFLHLFKVTKAKRTLYDHYMLHLHNAMKEDDPYQSRVEKTDIAFPAGSTWIVYTDQVSHAALSGQFLFEQTFYLPNFALQYPEKSPLAILEKFFNKKLV